MAVMWNCHPNEFQRVAISRILMMGCKAYGSTALLLVQTTGGGKSMVPMTIGSVTCGVILIIENTQALSADQVSKYSDVNRSFGPIEAFQLDTIKNQSDADALCKYLVSLQPDLNSTIYLYSSPECLLKPHYINMLQQLIAKSTLNLICIDEVHQFVSFGTSFRPQFCDLRAKLFNKIIIHGAHIQQAESTSVPVGGNVILKVPLLLMTATLNSTLLNNLQQMIGI